MTPSTDLTALAAKWRDEADGVTAMGYSQQGDRIRDCANELESALAALPREARDHRVDVSVAYVAGAAAGRAFGETPPTLVGLVQEWAAAHHEWMAPHAHSLDGPEYRRYEAARTALLAWPPAAAPPQGTEHICGPMHFSAVHGDVCPACEVCNDGCKAPAGVGISGVGYGDGHGSCRTTCTLCGEDVCTDPGCSRKARPGRVCWNCDESVQARANR